VKLLDEKAFYSELCDQRGTIVRTIVPKCFKNALSQESIYMERERKREGERDRAF
jgi:hypothetical protein